MNFSAFLGHLYRITNFDQVRGNVDTLAVDLEMVVSDKVPSLCPGVGKTETVDDIVQSALKKDKQVGTGDSFLPVGFLEKQMELLFGKSGESTHTPAP